MNPKHLLTRTLIACILATTPTLAYIQPEKGETDATLFVSLHESEGRAIQIRHALTDNTAWSIGLSTQKAQMVHTSFSGGGFSYSQTISDSALTLLELGLDHLIDLPSIFSFQLQLGIGLGRFNENLSYTYGESTRLLIGDQFWIKPYIGQNYAYLNLNDSYVINEKTDRHDFLAGILLELGPNVYLDTTHYPDLELTTLALAFRFK